MNRSDFLKQAYSSGMGVSDTSTIYYDPSNLSPTVSILQLSILIKIFSLSRYPHLYITKNR